MALGIALVVVGAVFASNFRQAAERLAASARPVPRWLKWPLTDDPGGYRIMGVIFAAMGALLVLTSPL